MGTFYVGCRVENHKDQKRAAVVPKLLVDTGSEFTWLPGEILQRIGIEPVKKDLHIQMANGQILTRYRSVMRFCAWINTKRLMKWFSGRKAIYRCSVRARWKA